MKAAQSLTTIGATNYRITLPSVEMIGVRAFRRVSQVHRVYISSKKSDYDQKGRSANAAV